MADPDRVAPLPPGPLQIVIFGRKGQGKTELAWLIWDSWDRDRLVIDVNGDVLKHHPGDLDTTDDVTPTSAWPEHLRRDGPDGLPARLSLRYVPDHTAAAPLYREDLDRAVGMAFAHPGTLLWVDEIGEVAPVHQVGGHTRRALHMGRHQDLYLVTTSPRPIGVDPLVLANADVVYVFSLPNANDQRRIADAIGWNRNEFSTEVGALPDHGYLRYVAAAHELSSWPPLPLERRGPGRIATRAILEPGNLGT
jgi:hypothetical protein